MDERQPDGEWRRLRRKFLSRLILPLLGSAVVGPYTLGLLLDLQRDQLQRALTVIFLPILVVVGLIQPWLLAGVICRTASATGPNELPGERLERLLSLPRRLELLCLLPTYVAGGMLFTLGCALAFGTSFTAVLISVPFGVLLAMLVGIPTVLLFQEDVLPLVVAEYQRAPRSLARRSNLLWPRQSWYLPYAFTVLLLWVVSTAVVIVGQKYADTRALISSQLQPLISGEALSKLQADLGEGAGQALVALLIVCGVLLVMFLASGWLMGQRERRAAQLIEETLRTIAQGSPSLPAWLGTDEIGDAAFAAGELSGDMKNVFTQLQAMAVGNLSVQLVGDSGLIQSFRSSQRGLLQLSEQMRVLSRGDTAVGAEMPGELGLAFGQLSGALLATVTQAKTIAQGDLRSEVQVTGELGLAINQMTTNLRSMVGHTQDVARQVNDIVVALRGAATQLSTATTEQVSALTETANTMTEMSQTSTASADRCVELIEKGESAAAVVERGQRGADDAGGAMQAISEALGVISSASSALAQKVQQVDGIIETVGFLADQSSTLAINAGIEASRAGDAGLGFSAVAREMRTLASDSRKATAQIREILQEIRQKTAQVDSSVAVGGKTVTQGVGLVKNLGVAINMLGVTIHDTAGLMRQVEGSARQHQAGVAQVTVALRSMQAASESIRDGARAVSTLSERAQELAVVLKRAAGSYQVKALAETTQPQA
ncbi:MAG: methyl-accepting chemotaxis protein [Archangium sp.]|nr:methyl-accepting chemotaxis protein [Archangium sp.]